MDDKNLTEIDESKFIQICDQIFDLNDRTDDDLRQLFRRFDATTKDGRLKGLEIENFQKWINNLNGSQKSALIIVDVQNDFIDGSLSISQGPAKQNGADIIPIINNLLIDIKFDLIVYTLDWHPENHISFYENVHLRKLSENHSNQSIKIFDVVTFAQPSMTKQKLWPKHCVQNSKGAELHSDMKFVENSLKIYKGVNPDVDSYSAFFDNKKLGQTGLHDELKSKNISNIFVCGLAYDICVADTCLDGLDLGYKTVLVKNCCRGLDSQAMDNVDQEIKRLNGVVIESDSIKKLMSNGRIPLAWGKFAMEKLKL